MFWQKGVHDTNKKINHKISLKYSLKKVDSKFAHSLHWPAQWRGML